MTLGKMTSNEIPRWLLALGIALSMFATAGFASVAFASTRDSVAAEGSASESSEMDVPEEPTRDQAVEAIEQQLRHAETYFWFGMAEHGNMAAYRKGLRHLKDASSRVAKLPSHDEAVVPFRARIAGIQSDLDEQITITIDTLYGVFPLIRFLSRSLFAESLTLGTYEVIDDPTVMASTHAAKLLALQTIEQWTGRHQLDVVFTSVPNNPQLENEALYVFNSHPKYFVHNLREVVDALEEGPRAEFQSGRVTTEVREALLEAFSVNDALVVNVKETDVVDGDYFYILEGKVYNQRSDSPTHDFAVMGFSRDRNAQFWPIVISNALLLVLAYGVFWLQLKVRRRATLRVSAMTFLVAPLAAFAIGRCAPWVLGPLLQSIAPIPESLAIASFWVPCLAGAALTVVPMFAYWIVSQRLGKIWPVLSMDGRGVAVCVAIGAGSVGFFAVPLFLYLPDQAAGLLVAVAVSHIGLGYLLGRALDGVDRLSIQVAVVPGVLSLLVGAAVFQGVAVSIWGAAGLVLVACALPAMLYAPTSADLRSAGLPAPKTQPIAVDGGPMRVEKISDRAEHPTYQRLPDFDRYRNKVRPLVEGKTVHLALHGVSGSGLSATADAIANDLAKSVGRESAGAVVMVGECANTAGERTPYGPFRKALAKHFEIELLAAEQSQMAEVNAALGEVFQSVVPFAGVLFPDAGGASTGASGEDIVPSILWMLRKLSQRRPVVLLIDDAQWLDESSRTLLTQLAKHFPVGGSSAIAILVASHDRAVLEPIGFRKEDIVEVGFPNAEWQVQILADGVGLTHASARQIVDRVSASTASQGGLFWLMQVVANLARNGAFVDTDEGAALPDGRWPLDIEIPDAMRDVLAIQLEQFSQRYRMVVECAACASETREFSASLVAEALDEPRLDLLAVLDRIDRETSILYDVRDEDDIFAFQSSMMLDVLRDELKIVEGGPYAEVPQIIREYHARLGACLEPSLEANTHSLYVVANHYYAAGATYAPQGTKYCLEAALAASGVLDFEAADNYLQRAAECAQVCGESANVEAYRLEVDCRRAHVTGQAEDHVSVAERGAEFLRQRPDVPTRLMLAVAQVHYDAGKSTGERTWFQRAIHIGRDVIVMARSPRDEAAGRHFVAISLPFDEDDARIDELRKALELVESEPEAHRDYELLGRVMGSLGEALSRGSKEDRKDAKAFFERRIEINQQYHVGDPRGQAMTHGGLGRLAFYYEPRDLDSAAFHFQKDLEISEAIGDQQGQIQMHSLLGACGLEQNDVHSALDHYQRSWDLARHPIAKTFAGAGRIACYVRLNQAEPLGETVRALLSITQEGVPEVCREELVAALTSCVGPMSNPEVETLLTRSRST